MSCNKCFSKVSSKVIFLTITTNIDSQKIEPWNANVRTQSYFLGTPRLVCIWFGNQLWNQHVFRGVSNHIIFWGCQETCGTKHANSLFTSESNQKLMKLELKCSFSLIFAIQFPCYELLNKSSTVINSYSVILKWKKHLFRFFKSKINFWKEGNLFIYLFIFFF